MRCTVTFSCFVVRVLFLLGLSGMTGCWRQAHSGMSVNVNSLLADLTNVAVFARSPCGTAGMLSSYDRTGGNNDWANLSTHDSNGDPVLVELKGPGVVHRLWMTGIPTDQRLNFYFDGESKARISTTISNLFGKAAPFLPPLCDNISGGFYCYMPLPYSNRLKITLSAAGNKVERPYFHINYERFEKKMRVESFPDVLDDATKHHIDEVCKNWSNISKLMDTVADECKADRSSSIVPNSRLNMLDMRNGGAIKAFWIKIDPPEVLSALGRSRLLREMTLRFYWDGSTSPSVSVPLGDFFCNPLRKWEFPSMVFSVTADRMICRFPMYFAKSARVEIENVSSIPVRIESAFDVGQPDARIGENYFHALWSNSSSPMAPHKIAGIIGKGHFVGCNLTQIGMEGGWNIFEGDEMIYVDGEAQPSFHGTGLEDYFNGGWYYYGLFSLPLHGLIEKAPIRSTQYRFHMGDRIPFSRGMLMNIEFGHGNASRGYMSSVAYWYQDKPYPVADRSASSWSLMPQDPLEPTAIMSALFEIERSARYDLAEMRCREYFEKYPASPWNDMLKLRAAAYRARQGKHENARAEYKKILQSPVADDVKHQAADLLWLCENPSNALLLTSFNGTGKLFLDGRQVEISQDPLKLNITRLNLSSGDHEFAAELAYHRSYAWLSVQLRTAKQVIDTDQSWLASDVRPTSWPACEGDLAGWIPAPECDGCPPFMPYWQFYPNAMVGCQAVNFISTPGVWSKEGKIIYYTKSFTVF